MVAYKELPDGDARGVFGADDVLGTLNWQGPETIRSASTLVRRGAMFSLNAPLDWPDPPLFNREPYQHHVYKTALGNRDDYVDNLYPQSSSQWDGFLHISDPDIGSYNHLPPERLGIESWAARGIAGRGVLFDVERWLKTQGEPLDWRTRRPISVEDLEGTRRWAGVELAPGDVLVLRTGWVTGYQTAPAADRESVRTIHDSPGLAAGDDMAAYLWDHGVSAVAADNIGVEAMPVADEMLHRKTLVRLGMPLGELWWLDDLAADCASDGRWEFFLTSAPWNMRGGIGSPANALAFK
ncbi:MAG: hypothetical protein JWQ74_108 [Marmoricola sp.]|nr:hypothetical protein [Marmoricola sp.]